MTILGATNYLFVNPPNATPAATSVQDDETGTTIQGCPYTTSGCAAVINSGVYALGESNGGGFTRLASSPASALYGTYTSVVPSWGSGVNNITSSPCYTPGALYSETDVNATVDSIYVCTSANTWAAL